LLHDDMSLRLVMFLTKDASYTFPGGRNNGFSYKSSDSCKMIEECWASKLSGLKRHGRGPRCLLMCIPA